MTTEASRIEVAPAELSDSLCALRLCSPQAQDEMEQTLGKLGQLTPIQAYRVEKGFEVFDGHKRLRAARTLAWSSVRVEVHALDAVGAKVRLWRCNVSHGLSDLEEAWLVRSLYREDGLDQPQIAMLLGRHKSWVCRRLTLAEGLSDELTANVRLGLLCPRAVVDLARLPRGNQDAVAKVVMRRGLTTRQTARLVDALLAAPRSKWDELLEQAMTADAAPSPPPPKGGEPRRTPGEQLVADSWAMKRMATRLHARLLERSLESLGGPARATVSHELVELRSTLSALMTTLDTRLGARGAPHAS